jgi:hypothetical protein
LDTVRSQSAAAGLLVAGGASGHAVRGIGSGGGCIDEAGCAVELPSTSELSLASLLGVLVGVTGTVVDGVGVTLEPAGGVTVGVTVGAGGVTGLVADGVADVGAVLVPGETSGLTLGVELPGGTTV